MDPQLRNVLILGAAFHLIFFAYHTSVFIQQTVVNSIRDRPEFNFTGDGYVSLCITYAVFSLANWLAPSMIALTGLKYGMFSAALVYSAYSASFLYPTTGLFYTAAALIGLSAGLLWTAQGGYLARLSNSTNSARNANLFWCMLQSSLLFGNLFVYFAFRDQTTIDDHTRYLVYGVLATIGGLGACALLLLTNDNKQSLETREGSVNALGQFLEAVKLARTREMLIFSMVSLYTGLFHSFFTGVYGTAIGATPHFGSDAKRYIGLSGIFVGIGEMLAGGMFGLRARKVSRREFIFLMGSSLSLLAFGLTFLSLPPDASLKRRPTIEPLIEPRIGVVILISTMFGIADSCFNTQVYAFLISAYKSNSVGAFALFKFVQSVGSALAFFYSTSLDLHQQLYILTVVTCFASLCFIIVERKFRGRIVTPVRDFECEQKVEEKL